MRIPHLLVVALALSALAADWPQWRGPARDNVSKEASLLASWPKEGPRLLWTYSDAGIGYSGPAIVGKRLFALGARGETEFVFAVDVDTGKEAWATEVGALFTNPWGDGPRSTPTVDGEVLYAMAAQGNLVCLEVATGKKRWSVSMTDDLGGEIQQWGYTESPLVDGNHVICSPGGQKGAIAGLDKKTGKVVWQSKDLKDAAGYSSIILVDVGGVRQYVQLTGTAVVGVSTKDGALLWREGWETDYGCNVATPIFHAGHVFVSSGYGMGCGLFQLTADGQKVEARKVYANKHMVNHHGGVLRVGEHLFGFSDGKGWVCQDFKSGDIVWAAKKLGKGSLTCADGRLYCYSESDGTVALIDPSAADWKETGRFRIPRETTQRKPSGGIWTHPVVANGRLYLRDQELLFCFDVKAGK